MARGTCVRAASKNSITRTVVRTVFSSMMLAANSDDNGFSSKSMQPGGLSTAKRAAISAGLLKFQSNHSNDAHNKYESDTGTDEEAIPELPPPDPPSGFKNQFSRTFGL